MPARCLIVDDEAPARDELRHLLDAFDDVEVVGEATTAEEAEVLVGAVAYDVILLDVRMPGIGGIELARTLHDRGDGAPAVVFTTAYPDHAVEAFELAAADYLVKPFDADRLRVALDRALARRGAPAPAPTGGVAGSVDVEAPPAAEEPREEPSHLGARIPVHRGNRIILVDEVRVAFAEASRGYAELKLVARGGGPTPLPDDKLLTSYTLGDLEERLSDAFVRTHRSFLVNLRHVREVVPQVGGTLTLVMADRDRSVVPVARRQGANVRRRLGV
ncbi:response regulator [Nitriliruptoraceae bacterium ZYF776]|nr:response regulator [Profundirhabdus halotolerans]